MIIYTPWVENHPSLASKCRDVTQAAFSVLAHFSPCAFMEAKHFKHWERQGFLSDVLSWRQTNIQYCCAVLNSSGVTWQKRAVLGCCADLTSEVQPSADNYSPLQVLLLTCLGNSSFGKASLHRWHFPKLSFLSHSVNKCSVRLAISTTCSTTEVPKICTE